MRRRSDAGTYAGDERVRPLSVQIALTPLYARGKNITLIAALSLEGMGAAMILEGSANTTAFDLYVEQVLAPSLCAGQIVIMDNLTRLYRRLRARSGWLPCHHHLVSSPEQ